MGAPAGSVPSCGTGRCSCYVQCCLPDANNLVGTRRVIICGGGIIGTAISYYLAKKGVRSTVVDRCGLAAAASGRAGGFLALDWNDATRLGPLARLSYQLHAGLEEELGMPLGYRHATAQCTITVASTVCALTSGALQQQPRQQS